MSSFCGRTSLLLLLTCLQSEGWGGIIEALIGTCASPKFDLVIEARCRACLDRQFYHCMSIYTSIWRDFLVCKHTKHYNWQSYKCRDIFLWHRFFSIVNYVSPDGFFGIQILPNSITAVMSISYSFATGRIQSFLWLLPAGLCFGTLPGDLERLQPPSIRAFQFGQKKFRFDSILATESIFSIRFGNLIDSSIW